MNIAFSWYQYGGEAAEAVPETLTSEDMVIAICIGVVFGCLLAACQTTYRPWR
jgi:hypothetical protein